MIDVFKPFRKKEEPEDGEAIARHRAGLQRLGALAVGGIVAAKSGLVTESQAQVLSTQERMELAGSVDVLDYLARDPSTPEKRVSLYRQIVEGFGEELERQGPRTIYGHGHHVFMKGTGRSAIMIDGNKTVTQEGAPFMRNVSAYLQVSDRVLAKLQTFDFEPDRSYVTMEVVVLGNAVSIDTPHIIDIGKDETPGEMFQRIPLLFSGKSTSAISATIDKKTGEIKSCNAFTPITNLPEHIQALGAQVTMAPPITEVVLATENERVQKEIQPEAKVIAEKMWYGIAMHFATGS